MMAINNVHFLLIIVSMLFIPLTSVSADDLDIDIQIIEENDSPDSVVNRIQLPDFLSQANANKNRSDRADGKGKASLKNPNLTGNLPGNGLGRSEEARQSTRNKAHGLDNKPADNSNKPQNTNRPDLP